MGHRLGHGPVTGLLGDQAVHLEHDPPVGRMALRPGTQLEQVDRLAGVELHDVPQAIGHRDGVRRLLRELLGQRLVQPRRAVHGLVERRRLPGVVDELGAHVPVVRRQALPLDRQQPVPLQVAERAVVRQHVEAVVDPLEGPARLVPAVLPLADVRPHQRQPLGRPEPGDSLEQLVLGQVRVRVADGRQQLVLGLADRSRPA